VANTKSAAKRARQSVKQHARNKSVTSSVRTQIRKVREAIEKKDAGTIDIELKKAVAALDKAASKGVIHSRNASRRVGRLSSAAAAAKAAPKA
jgi:small subunit ribosomal protein S20